MELAVNLLLVKSWELDVVDHILLVAASTCTVEVAESVEFAYLAMTVAILKPATAWLITVEPTMIAVVEACNVEAASWVGIVSLEFVCMILVRFVPWRTA